jgi:tetratricopeptide (TPR) repeat protein
MLDFERSIELRPDHVATLCLFSRVQAERGRLNDGLATINHALSIAPTNPEAHAVRGAILRQQAEQAAPKDQQPLYQQALDDFKQAIPGCTDLTEAYFQRGQVQLALGHADEAEQDLTEALVRRQNDPLFLFWHGKAQLKRGATADAIKNFSDSLTVDSNQPDVLYERGCALLAEGDPKQARKDFEELLKQRPDDPQAIAKLAIAKHRSGDVIGAVPHYLAGLRRWTGPRGPRQP